MNSPAFYFLPIKQFASINERVEGLASADARSHAARTAHARAKDRKDRLKRSSHAMMLHHDTSIICEQCRQPSNEVTRRWQRCSLSFLSSPTSCGREPFLVVADNLSMADSNQLHWYLTRYTAAIDSTKPRNSFFCPVRDLLLSKLAVSAAMVQCLMLISDLAVNANCQLVCLRRMIIFQKLRELVEDDQIFEEPSTAMTLATAIVAEYRAGNINAAKCHGTALQNWFAARGGFDAIESMPLLSQTGLLAILTCFDITIFTSKDDFDRALASFKLPVGHGVPVWLSRYVFAAGEGTQVALLYILNSVLQYRQPDFLCELRRRVLSNTELAPGALILTIAESISRTAPVATPPIRIRETIEFVQLLSFATRATRTAVVRSMAGVLHGLEPMAIDLGALKREIREGWTRTLSRRKHGDDVAVTEVAVGSPFRRDESTGQELPWILNVDITTESCPHTGPETTKQLRCPMWRSGNM